jgi:hypothetical protein
MNQPYDLGRNHLLALLMRAGTVLLAVLILSITGCNMHSDYQAARAIEKGADPVAVACVFGGNMNGSCSLAAARAPQ